MASITHASGEKPGMTEKPVMSGPDIETPVGADDYNKELGGQDPNLSSDEDSTHKQGGVKAIEAVTSVWSKKTLWLMMVL